MHLTPISTLAVALAVADSVSAHARMYSAWVNDVDQGDGRGAYIRSPPNNSPVKDLASPDLNCGSSGGTPVPEFIQTVASDTLSFEWYHDTRHDDIIDASHLGPVVTYIADYTEGDGTGPIWTKIHEDGYDGEDWGVDRLRTNHGRRDFVLPADLAAGKYLIRQEIIAHHESDHSYATNPSRGAQFYPSCVQVEVAEGGTAVPDQGFDLNAGYEYDDPGILFNLYAEYTSYKVPGPEVWTGGRETSELSPLPPLPHVVASGNDGEESDLPLTLSTAHGTPADAPPTADSPASASAMVPSGLVTHCR